MDPVSATAMTFGVVLLLVSWVYLMIIAFKTDYTWGLVTIFLPFIAYIYAFFDWRKTQAVIWSAALGWVLIIVAL